MFRTRVQTQALSARTKRFSPRELGDVSSIFMTSHFPKWRVTERISAFCRRNEPSPSSHPRCASNIRAKSAECPTTTTDSSSRLRPAHPPQLSAPRTLLPGPLAAVLGHGRANSRLPASGVRRSTAANELVSWQGIGDEQRWRWEGPPEKVEESANTPVHRFRRLALSTITNPALYVESKRRASGAAWHAALRPCKMRTGCT